MEPPTSEQYEEDFKSKENMPLLEGQGEKERKEHEDMSPPQEEGENIEGKIEKEIQTDKSPKIEQPGEHGHEDEHHDINEDEKEDEAKKEESPKECLPTKSPIKHLTFTRDSNEEEGEDTRVERETSKDKEIEVIRDEENDNSEPPK